MDRRTVLSLMIAGVAGCSAAPSRSTTSAQNGTAVTTESRSTSRSARTSTRTTDQHVPSPPDVAIEVNQAMSKSDVKSTISRHDCSEFSTGAVCEGSDGRVSISAQSGLLSLPADVTSIRISNAAETRYATNFYRWKLYKYGDKSWHALGPGAVPGVRHYLQPGEAHEYILSVDNETVRERGPDEFMEQRDLEFAGFGPGVYGFKLRGEFEDEESPTEPGIVFGMYGNGRDIVPSTGLEIERTNQGFTLETGKNGPSRELVFERTDGEEGAVLLDEHIHQPTALSNAIPYLINTDAKRVTYRSNASDVNAADNYLNLFGVELDTFTYRAVTFTVQKSQ